MHLTLEQSPANIGKKKPHHALKYEGIKNANTFISINAAEVRTPQPNLRK